MKGEPLRWTYTQRFSMADYQRYAINGGGNTQVGKYASELVNFQVSSLIRRHAAGSGNYYHGDSAQECCEDCAAILPDTKHISYKQKHKSKCYCFSDPNPPICDWSGSGCFVKYYVSGTCAFPDSGRKKRNVDQRVANEKVSMETSFRNTSLSQHSSSNIIRSKKREVENSLIRKKRNAEESVVRQITCEPLWGGTAGYWGYQYTVPEYCFSK